MNFDDSCVCERERVTSLVLWEYTHYFTLLIFIKEINYKASDHKRYFRRWLCFLVKKSSIFLLYAIGNCFNPYIAFLSIYTLSLCPFISNPGSYLTYTSSYSGLLKKVDFTSNWCFFHPVHVAMGTIILMVSSVASGAYAYLKLIPCLWRNPFATNIALYLAISPFGPSFSL